MHTKSIDESKPLEATMQNIQHKADVITFNSRSVTQSLDFGRLETKFLEIQPQAPDGNDEIASPPRHDTDHALVWAGERTGPFNGAACELTVASLFECPKYTTLSYSLGDQSNTQPIMLDGEIRQVTASLEVALRELQRRGVHIAWVYALCINLDNNYEKVYQLSQMRKIFSKASKVIVWLGPAADASDIAMQALSVGDNSDDDSDDSVYALSAAENEDGIVRRSVAIANLLDRPYWQRVWIIQEIAKASVVEVWCGSKTLTWDVFFTGVQRWWHTAKHHANGLDYPVFTLKFFCMPKNRAEDELPACSWVLQWCVLSMRRPR